MKLLLRAALPILAAIPVCGSALAHQTYVISDVAVMVPGSLNFLTVRNGTFHESANSITHPMTADLSVIQHGQRTVPTAAEMFDADDTPSYKSSHVKVTVGKPGTALVGVATQARVIGFPAEMYADYLGREGLTDALDAFKGSQLTTVRERYTKHAKSIFQIGDALTDDYTHKLGYRAEIFLERNPGEMKPGDDATFYILFDGKPLPNQLVHVEQGSKKSPLDAGVAAGAVYKLRTDQNGRGAFQISARDKWAISMIQIQKASDSAADFESNYSTLSFEIR